MNKINVRLRKIIGQLNGLIKLIDGKEDDCEKIIIQFQASKAALSSAFSEILNEHLEYCLNNKDEIQMRKIIKLIAKK